MSKPGPLIAILGVFFSACGDIVLPGGSALRGDESAFVSAPVSTTDTVIIVNEHSQKCLQLASPGAADGALLQQSSCDGSSAQRFRFQAADSGYHRLESVHSGKCIDIAGGSTAAGANVIQWTCHTGANQQWRVEDVGGNVVRLIARHSNLALDVHNASMADGARLTQWAWNGGSNQKFAINGVASGGSGGSAGSGGTAGSGSGAVSGSVSGTRPFKGVANSSCAARTALNVSWYYNWMQNESEPCRDGRGGAFVPMIWGHAGNEQSAAGITNAVAALANREYRHVLGFNEPDNGTQANIPVATAVSLLPSFDNPAVQIGSPATAANANPGQAWFTDFMSRVNANASLRVDFLAIHWYGWNAGSCDANATQLENYIRWAERFAGNRPIWITEWGCLNASAPDVETVVRFYQGALAVFGRHPRVERYAWYPWAKNCGLVNADGSLTALGTAFAAAPAFR